MAGIAAPVYRWGSGERRLLGALISTMPANRYREEHIVIVVKSAATLTAALGA